MSSAASLRRPTGIEDRAVRGRKAGRNFFSLGKATRPFCGETRQGSLLRLSRTNKQLASIQGITLDLLQG